MNVNRDNTYSSNLIKPGDMVWFDAFYHKDRPGDHPSQYSVEGIVIKKYSESEKLMLLGEDKYGSWVNEGLFEIMMDGNLYPAPERTLRLMYRQEELI